MTIPVCMIATFAFIYFLGFSINTITLMAFVLAIGLVVDDAIVMLENIKRYIESGLSVKSAALKGSREMIFPIIAMTITLAAVYAPIAFTPGLLGVLFREFTFTLAGAVILSGVVALTLTPMMCSQLLTDHDHDNRYDRWQAAQFNKLQEKYQALLSKMIRYRAWILLMLILLSAIGGGLYWLIKSELAPFEDTNTLYVSFTGPRDGSYSYTDQYVKRMEEIYKTIPDIESYFSMSGTSMPSKAFQLLMLKPKDQRQQSIKQILAEIDSKTSQMHGVWVNAFMPPPPLSAVTGNEDGDRLSIVLMTSGDYRGLQETSKTMLESLKQNPLFTHVYNSLRWDSDQFQVTIDREKAADLRLPISSISNTLSTLLAGKNIGKLDESNILLQMNKESLANPNIFNQIYVRNTSGKMVSLSNVLKVNSSSASEVYKHYSRLRADMLNIGLAPNTNMAEAMNILQPIIKEHLQDNMKFTYTGEAKNMLESNGKTAMTFGLALIFIYLVLVAQFESFIDPFIILLTVPFAVIGAMLTLFVFNGTLNIYSHIGLITLVGLITKHGILIVDFANKQYLAGTSIQDAIIHSAKLRLRPILMTTAAMVLGALPLAFAVGPGAESRQQIGLVVTGGMLLGTIFSLIVVPVAYTYLAPFKKIQPDLALETE
jgi:multidrug efflux pump